MGLVLSDLAGYLVTKGLGTLGVNIFRGSMPDSPPECISLQEYGGLAPQTGFGVDGMQYEFPAVQLKIRGKAKDYDGPRAVAQNVMLQLMRIQGVTVGTSYYHMVRPQQSVFQMDRPDNDLRFTFAFNVICEKRP